MWGRCEVFCEEDVMCGDWHEVLCGDEYEVLFDRLV